MGRIRLSDEDRERLGLKQEWIESFDVERFMLADAELLEANGYDPDEFMDDLQGQPVVRDGQPVMVAEFDSDGNEVLVDGKPKMHQKVKRSFRLRRALVWLAVRKAGLTVSFDDFDFQIVGVRHDFSGDPPEGKGHLTAPTSSKSAKSTRSRSPRPSGSSRGKSTS